MHDERGAASRVSQKRPSASIARQRRRGTSLRNTKGAPRARGVSYDAPQVAWSSLGPMELAAAFQYATTAMAIVDADRRILAANTALCELVGLSQRELLTRSLAQLLGIDSGTDSASEVTGWPQLAALGAETQAQFECPLTT